MKSLRIQHMMVLAATLSACVIDPTDDDDAAGDTEGATDTNVTSGPSSGNTDGEGPGSNTQGETTNPGSDTEAESSGNPETTDDTDTGSGDGMYCTFECAADEDCQVMGMDIGLTCESNRCAGEAPTGCTDDDFCIAQLSGWSAGMACEAEADCAALMQHCVEVAGAGHCATGPTEFVTCETLMMDEIETTNIDGDPVTLCGNSNATCRDDGICFDPCTSDDDCFESAPVCDTATGICGCTEDAHCETLGVAANSACLDTGACGCDSDDDCDEAVGDVCTSLGICGCSSVDACEGFMNPYDGGTLVCAGA